MICCTRPCAILIYVLKNGGHRACLGENDHVISLNCSAFIGNLSSSEGARARARANHVRNEAQKGCVMQLNGITLRTVAPIANAHISAHRAFIPRDHAIPVCAVVRK